MNTFPILEPPTTPIMGMRTTPHPLLLSVGEQALIQNLRWGDTGSPVIRDGISQYFAVPTDPGPVGYAVSLIDTWAGELNGDRVFMVALVFAEATASTNIIAATAASPIVCQTTGAHGLTTNDWIYVHDTATNTMSIADTSGMQINDVANNGFKASLLQVTSVDATHFSLNSTTGTGTFATGPSFVKVKIRIFASVNGGVLTEITSQGNGCFFGSSPASTRFPNITDLVTFCAIRTPGGLESGSTIVPRDTVLISNGVDSMRLWAPKASASFQMSIHDPLTLPSNALTSFGYQSYFKTFGQVAGTTGKTYPRVVNTSNSPCFSLSDSTMFRLPVAGATAATPSVLNVVAHGLATGVTVTVTDIVGTTGVDGSFVITVVDANHFSLNGSTGVGVYTSGGIVQASGSLTVSSATTATPVKVGFTTAHLAQSGDVMYFSGLAGIQGANGWFSVKVFDSTHVTLDNSVGSGTYTSGGTAAYTQYTGASTVPMLTIYDDANLTSSHPAALALTTPFTIAKQLIMVVEGQDPIAVLRTCKVSISPDAGAYSVATNWYDVYDPTSSTVNNAFAAYAYADPTPAVSPTVPTGALQGTQNRYIIAFALNAIPSNTALHHLRLTWNDSAAQPVTTTTMAILMLASAGGYPGGTQWGLAYEDEYSRSESYGIEASSVTSTLLNAVGGPSLVTTPIPPLEAIQFDYNITVPNLTVSGFLSGGLAKNPTLATIYMRLPRQTNALYGFGLRLLDPVVSAGVSGWVLHPSSGETFTVSTADLSFFTKNLADPTRPMPSAFQIAIPPARAMCFGSSRLFVGDVYNPTYGTRISSDVYFSAASQPFRMSSVPVDAQGNYDSAGASRATFVAESIKSIVASASMSEAASFVFVHTTTAVHMLGGGGIMGAQTDANSLGNPHRIGAMGTQSHRTVQERNGVIIWVDNEGCVRRMYGGFPQDISRKHINNQILAIDASQRRNIAAIWTRDRYYLLLGDGRMIIWHEPTQAWESIDVTSKRYIRLATLYDPTINGTGRKLLASAADMLTYWHENGTQDLGSDIAMEIDSREINFGDGKAAVIDHTNVLCDPPVNASVTIDVLYRPWNSLYRATAPLGTGYGTDPATARTEVVAPADGDGERGTSARLKIYGSFPGRTSFISIISYVQLVSSHEASSE